MKENIANTVVQLTNSILNTLLGDGVTEAADHLRKIRNTSF
jgi:hypothetical protein